VWLLADISRRPLKKKDRRKKREEGDEGASNDAEFAAIVGRLESRT